MSKINNIRLATAALVTMFVCDLSMTTNICASERPAPQEKPVSYVTFQGMDMFEVKFDKNNPGECFHALQSLCDGPKDLRHRSYLFPIACRALVYNKDKVLEMVRHYIKCDSIKLDVHEFGGGRFLQALDFKDRTEFLLDLGNLQGAMGEILEEALMSRMLEHHQILGSGVIESLNPKTEEGKNLKADLLEYYRFEKLLED